MANNELPLGAKRLMGWCRKVALMSKEEFSLHYRVSLSTTAKRQLSTFPAINTGPRDIGFPWHPDGFTSNTQIQQERSPPIARLKTIGKRITSTSFEMLHFISRE